MKKKAILSMILCLVLALALTACTTTVNVQIPEEAYGVIGALVAGGSANSAGSNSAAVPADNTPAETPAADTPAADAPAADTPAADTPAADTPAATTPAADTPAASTPAETPAASNGMPQGKEAIVKYYVDAYNKISTDSKSTTRTYDYTSNYNSILNINNNSTLEKLAQTLMDKFMVENTEPVTGTAKELPPVGLATINIPADKVSDATIKDNGSTYEIVLKSTGTDKNQEQDLNPGDGSAGLIGPLLRTEDVSSAASGFLTFDGLHAYYHTATVTATVDKASGHITELKYVTPCILHFDEVKVVVLKVQNCDIGLLFQQTWTVQY
ncbi:MAG: hypothetical protein IJJ85_11605 [Clostridia bacterium]|nr:hypothetical protein [Clostridia bacterium]